MPRHCRFAAAVAALCICFSVPAVCASAQTSPAAADDIQAEAKAAVETVTRLFTINPLVKLDATHASLPTTGSWGAGQIKPERCPDAMCMRVLYRVPDVGVVCSWVIRFTKVSAPDGKLSVHQEVTDEDENARLYTLKKDWLPGERYPIPARDNPHIVYPANARAGHVGGIVVADAIIDDHGKVEQVLIQSGPKVLQPEVIATVSQWQFQPQTMNSKPITVRRTLTFTFGLYGNGAVAQIGMDGDVYGSAATGARAGTLTGGPSSRPVIVGPNGPNQILLQPGPPQ
jgi:TonB family protein